MKKPKKIHRPIGRLMTAKDLIKALSKMDLNKHICITDCSGHLMEIDEIIENFGDGIKTSNSIKLLMPNDMYLVQNV